MTQIYAPDRVVYEGATNTKITCESNSLFVGWQSIPFAFTQWNDMALIVYNEVVDPSFSGSFAVEHSEGTEVYSLVVFNATLSPSPIVSTAGYYMCMDSDNYAVAHLVVVRKHDLSYLNAINY